jgi:hypothetical protein
MANLKTTAKGVAASAKQALAKGASNAINAVTDKFKPKDAAAEPAKVEPTIDAPAEPAKTGSFNNQLGGGKANYSVDPSTMKNTSTPMDPKDVNVAPKKKKVAVSASKVNTGNPLSEAPIPGVLQQSVIDKAFLKAAQENEIVKTKQGRAPVAKSALGTATGDASPAQNAPADDTSGSSQGGFGAGFKKGFTGKPAATPNVADLEKRIAAIEKKVGLA